MIAPALIEVAFVHGFGRLVKLKVAQRCPKCGRDCMLWFDFSGSTDDACFACSDRNPTFATKPEARP